MEQPSLSRKRAYECEHAIEKRCRCRCGGRLHGAARFAAADLHRLPINDPHHVPRPIDTGLRAIEKVTHRRGRLKNQKVYIAHLVCGHTVEIPASKLGPNRSRAHCEKCAPTQVMVSRQRRAEGMDKTLMEFFEKEDKRNGLRGRRRYKASKFPIGAWHVIDVDEPDYAIGPGSSNEKAIRQLADLMNKLPR